MKNLAVFLFCLAFASSGLFAESVSRKDISVRMNEKIVSTLRESQENVYDYNGDGLVNCLDYSCIFKLTWDENYPSEKYSCSLIHNVNDDVMNHLFAQIRDEYYNIIEVETWAQNPNRYLMSENWPVTRYNPRCNRYGETEVWLSKGNRTPYSLKNVERVVSTDKKSYSYKSSVSSGGYISFGYTKCMEKNDTPASEKYGLEFSAESPGDREELFAIFAIDYLKDCRESRNTESVLVGYAWGYGLSRLFQPYFGGTLGVKWNNSFDAENIAFAWKVNGGVRILLSSFSFRTDISYNSIFGMSGTLAFGIWMD